MLLTREDIAAVYAGGVAAVSGVIAQRQALSVAQQEQICHFARFMAPSFGKSVAL